MRLTVVGLGYVGASTAVLLSQKHRVAVIDISCEKLEDIRQHRSPLIDEDMERFFEERDPDISVSENDRESYRDSDFVLIATSTNYDNETGHLETTSVESVIGDVVRSGGDACIVIKSTIPTGFMSRMQMKYPDRVFLYVPEFLREGNIIEDQLHPTRIVIGLDEENGKSQKAADTFVEGLLECIEDRAVPVMKMSFGEAESVKLFSNTYLAMRVAFFNELDTFAEKEGFDTKNIIEGVCLDPRIGNWYNNPSFGYGGYCLPKDTKQLLSHFDGMPQKVIGAIVESNETRKDHIVSQVVKRDPGIVGIYRLVMKEGSDNFRESSIVDIMNKISSRGTEIMIYEPLIKEATYEGFKVNNDFNGFVEACDIIIANRISDEIKPYIEKVYTRDVFGDN